MEFYTFTLPNGIRCIHKRVHSPVAYTAVTVGAGTRDESPDEYGMAHLVEHTLFKGTRRRRAYHINCRLENLGGELNAYTSKEDTVIHATTLQADFPKAAELISDILFSSVFPEREVEKEKEVILDEINYFKDTPSERVYDDFEDMVFAGSELGHNILGSKTSLSRLHSDRIRSFVKWAYNTDGMVFSCIGNVSERRFRAAAERYFGNAPANIRGFARHVPPPVAPFERRTGRANHQTHCITGGRAYPLDSPKRLPLMLLVNLLGGPSANSLLNLSLREKNALSYNVEASYTPYADSGIASVCLSCEHDKTDRCLELIDRELSKLMREPLTPRRLAIAKKQFTGQFAISSDGSEGYMLGAAKSLLSFGTVDTREEIYGRIAGITPSDIAEVAAEVFSVRSTLIYK